jgi:hypothetical protein
MYRYIKEHETLLPSFTGFILKPSKLVFYFGRTHLAIEYYGPERISKIQPAGESVLIYHDLTRSKSNFIEDIVGIKYDSTSPVAFPLPPFSEDLILPTNDGIDKLVELKWNFAAQESILAINAGNYYIPEGSFTRLINSLFFDADENGLKTRHIKWIDFIPLKYDDSHDDHDRFIIDFSGYTNLIIPDCHYIYPLPTNNDYKFSKLPRINRFIELIANKNNNEPKITAFLAKQENQFILTMAFLAKEVHHQLKCEWQSEKKDPIQPDFFIVSPNGYANIVEFKLPYLKSKAITGRTNRETFSAEVNSYISQTRTYKAYFEDPNNRIWFEKTYGFKVNHPRRILVAGRRWDFDNEEWRNILSDYIDIEILNYEDLIDGVVAQFYM